MNRNIQNSDNLSRNRIKSEIDYWEKSFFIPEEEQKCLKKPIIYDDRLFPRKKLLIDKLVQFVNQQSKVLEVGGGSFKTIKYLLDPDSYKYFFIGSDISLNALKIGKRRIRNGKFVQCNVEALPFLPMSFDIIFSFGVLHHTCMLERNILVLFEILKNEGILVLHERIDNELKTDSIFIKLMKNVVAKNNEESAPMESKINLNKLLGYIKNNSEILFLKHEYSPVRLVLVKLFRKLIPKSLILLKFIIFLDDLTILFSRIFELSVLKGTGIMAIIKKTSQ